MSEPVQIRRPVCEACLRPRNACICRWMTPVASLAEVLILQHPLEVANPKGSARLLHLSLPNSRLAVGEAFDEAQLVELLHGPWRSGQAAEGSAESAMDAMRQPVLLYPALPGRDDAANLDVGREPANLRLVVLDATWRKSRKMLYLNPLLQALPRLALQDPPPSRYLVRKAHLPHQLSTLEAACQALMQLENDAPKYQPLLQAFDGFVARQLSYRQN